jgi:formylglycine-generating enzyme required for sulfatase activity/tRNA A-37 threonylcarbamoyl transferase component Bud32
MSSFEAYAAALSLLEAYLERRRAGTAEPEAELLAAHPDLAEVLAAMLADAPATTGTHAQLAPPADWRGLPGEGQTLGGYRIERLLGQGGMGVVFLAADLRLSRKVALKLIRPERLGSPAARDRFWREAKLAARLEHRNICPVYEVSEVNGAPFMAMRYLEGETLAAQIARAAQPTSRTGSDAERRRIADLLALLETVARALHFAHAHGVVHRDVKPANILIEPDGQPVVLDFGMAVGTDDELGLTMTGELAGTPLYMAPEQVAPSARGVDQRADVYALGVTLYEAVTLVRPFGGQSMRELLDAIVNGSAPPASAHNRALPRDLDVVIEKALEKDLDRRYRTAADLADDLARVRANQPVLARRAGRVLRVRRWAQRNPLPVAFLALATAALVAISLLYARGEALRADYDMVAFVRRFEELRAAETDLYATWPDHEPALRGWLADAERLRVDIESVRPALARLGKPGPEGPTPPDDPARRFVFEALRNVVAQADALAQPGGSIARVQRNRDALARERAQQAEHAAAWAAARTAIAAHPRYGGLQLQPQFGLVPLGPDPITSLWEFAHPSSGELPARGADGRFVVGDATGVVFVLLPGGPVTVGSQRDKREQPNYDPDARLNEGKPNTVTLEPLLIGKYELTQAQWMRLTGGANPAEAQPGSAFAKKLKITLAHPVEMVSWNACTRVLRQYGLTLPTEAQWEYAARGETSTPWFTGAEPASLRGQVNIADATAAAAGAEWFELFGLRLLPDDVRAEFKDGYVWHAPVDVLAANGFGLHHVAGNVWEWCRDSYTRYGDAPARPRDGLRADQDGQ